MAIIAIECNVCGSVLRTNSFASVTAFDREHNETCKPPVGLVSLPASKPEEGAR